MDAKIRLYTHNDLSGILELSVLAWEPVFVAWKRILGPSLYRLAIYPEHPDWQTGQKDVVQKIVTADHVTTWVADVAGKVVGFIAYKMNHDSKEGEVELLAVHPDYQNGGIGTQLNILALEKFTEAGMTLAVVGTGGDEGHAPARRSYEKAGYTGLPAVRYYKEL